MIAELEATYTIDQVAAHFHVSVNTVRRMIKLRRINARRAGLRKFYFTRQDIEAAGRKK